MTCSRHVSAPDAIAADSESTQASAIKLCQGPGYFPAGIPADLLSRGPDIA